MKTIAVLYLMASVYAQAESASGDYPKSKTSTFNAVVQNQSGSTSGWSMFGLFTVSSGFKGDIPILTVELDVLPASTDVIAANQVYQSYIQFNNWDPKSTPDLPSFNNVVASYYLTGTSKAWAVSSY